MNIFVNNSFGRTNNTFRVMTLVFRIKVDVDLSKNLHQKNSQIILAIPLFLFNFFKSVFLKAIFSDNSTVSKSIQLDRSYI